MTTFAELVTRVREALSVDDSYEATVVPYGVQRAGKRLLRDYHFPWSVNKQVFEGLAAGAQDYELPSGFKKELLVHFFDTQDLTYTGALLKREGFVQAQPDGVPRYYWFWQNNLSTDILLPAASAATTNLVVWYESMDWDTNASWMIDRFEDILYTYATFRLAAELNKTELAQIYAALWTDEQKSLAIYLNELEFDNGEYVRREASPRLAERYPA